MLTRSIFSLHIGTLKGSYLACTLNLVLITTMTVRLNLCLNQENEDLAVYLTQKIQILQQSGLIYIIVVSIINDNNYFDVLAKTQISINP